MIRRTTLAVATAAATMLAACGGDGGGAEGDPRAEIESTFRALARAIVANDGRAGCALMTPELRATYADQLVGVDDAEDRARRCAAAVDLLMFAWPEDHREALRHIEVRRVRVDGDRAELHDDDLTIGHADRPDPDPRPIVFRRVEGKWLIAELN
jgi:hypothetical protein